MAKGKERHNNDNQKKKFCNRMGWRLSNGKIKCSYFDGDGINTFDKECMNPWSSECKDGNIFNCLKLKLKWKASLSEHKKKLYEEKGIY